MLTGTNTPSINLYLKICSYRMATQSHTDIYWNIARNRPFFRQISTLQYEAHTSHMHIAHTHRITYTSCQYTSSLATKQLFAGRF